jgi:hypothetical protein
MSKPGTPKLSDVIRQRDEAVMALAVCAAKFQEYADHHLQKGDKVKAIANSLMRDMCRNTIKRATWEEE